MQLRVTRRLLGLVFVPVGLAGVVLALYDFGRYLSTGDSLLTDVGKDVILFNYAVSIFFLFGAGAALAGVGWILAARALAPLSRCAARPDSTQPCSV